MLSNYIQGQRQVSICKWGLFHCNLFSVLFFMFSKQSIRNSRLFDISSSATTTAEAAMGDGL